MHENFEEIFFQTVFASRKVDTRSDLLNWVEVFLKKQIQHEMFACLMVSSSSKQFQILDAIHNIGIKSAAKKIQKNQLIDLLKQSMTSWFKSGKSIFVDDFSPSPITDDTHHMLAALRIHNFLLHGFKDINSPVATFFILFNVVPTMFPMSVTDLLDLIAPHIHQVRVAMFQKEKHQRKSMSTVPVVTPREKIILGLLSQGKTDEEVALKLKRSVHTIKNQVRNIIEKFGAENRVHALVMAYDNNLLDLTSQSVDTCPTQEELL